MNHSEYIKAMSLHMADIERDGYGQYAVRGKLVIYEGDFYMLSNDKNYRGTQIPEKYRYGYTYSFRLWKVTAYIRVLRWLKVLRLNTNLYEIFNNGNNREI